jgi:hypothetical protein
MKLADIKQLGEALNHMGEREYQTFQSWKAACKKAHPGCTFRGDKDIGAAVVNGKDVGEWDGAVGSVFKPVTESWYILAPNGKPVGGGHPSEEAALAKWRTISPRMRVGLKIKELADDHPAVHSEGYSGWDEPESRPTPSMDDKADHAYDQARQDKIDDERIGNKPPVDPNTQKYRIWDNVDKKYVTGELTGIKAATTARSAITRNKEHLSIQPV